jgi:hypothetical protein
MAVNRKRLLPQNFGQVREQSTDRASRTTSGLYVGVREEKYGNNIDVVVAAAL